MIRLLTAIILMVNVTTTAQTENPKYNKALAESLGGDEYGMKAYVLAILKTGAYKTNDKKITDSLFRGHMENIQRLSANGKLTLAGPFGKNDRNYRGIFILNVKTIEEAKVLVATDPAVKAELFDVEFYEWYGSAALPEYLKSHEKIELKKTLVMNETMHIKNLFQDLYNGNPWLDVTLVATLENISSEQAAQKKYADRNSIWEITNHVVSWRLNVLERVKGITITTPEHNYFVPVEDTSETAWKLTLTNLKESQQKWTDFLEKFQDSELENIYAANGHRHYEHIHGIIQHDCYHLGQIVLLAKHPD